MIEYTTEDKKQASEQSTKAAESMDKDQAPEEAANHLEQAKTGAGTSGRPNAAVEPTQTYGTA